MSASTWVQLFVCCCTTLLGLLLLYSVCNRAFRECYSGCRVATPPSSTGPPEMEAAPSSIAGEAELATDFARALQTVDSGNTDVASMTRLRDAYLDFAAHFERQGTLKEFAIAFDAEFGSHATVIEAALALP
jgi:hypothetical protein